MLPLPGLMSLFCSLIPSWSCCWKSPGPPRSETCSGPLQFSMKINLGLIFLSESLTLSAYSQCSCKAAVVLRVGVWDSCLEQQLEQGLVHEAVPAPQQGRCQCQPCVLGAEWRSEKHQWREKAKSQKQQKIKEKKIFFGPVKIFVKICLLNKSLALLFFSVLLLGLHFLLLCLLSMSYLDCLWLKVPACLQCEGCLFFKHLHDDHAVAWCFGGLFP